MRYAALVLLLFVALAVRLRAQDGAPPSGESLVYNVNWPSGLSLGEIQLKAAEVDGTEVDGTEGSGERWNLEFTLDAAIPGFTVADRYRSLTTSEFCSIQFDKQVSHGKKTGREQTRFDPQAGSATRQTVDGGSSRLQTGTCARDALAFLYHLRRELAQGRLPPPQTVYFGAPYQVRFHKRLAGVFEADRIRATLKGPASETVFEMFFAQDSTRRPVLIRAPLPLGLFSMELAP